MGTTYSFTRPHFSALSLSQNQFQVVVCIILNWFQIFKKSQQLRTTVFSMVGPNSFWKGMIAFFAISIIRLRGHKSDNEMAGPMANRMKRYLAICKKGKILFFVCIFILRIGTIHVDITYKDFKPFWLATHYVSKYNVRYLSKMSPVWPTPINQIRFLETHPPIDMFFHFFQEIRIKKVNI